MNWILYGNTQGIPANGGKSSDEYNQFLSEVFNNKKECIGCHKMDRFKGELCDTCWKNEPIDEENELNNEY